MDYMEGVKALVCGMTTVFVVLIVIAIIIDLFKFIKPKTTEKKHEHNEIVAIIEKGTPKQQDDLEIIAVITAAIAASLNTTSDNLVVTSFRKIRSTR